MYDRRELLVLFGLCRYACRRRFAVCCQVRRYPLGILSPGFLFELANRFLSLLSGGPLPAPEVELERECRDQGRGHDELHIGLVGALLDLAVDGVADFRLEI